MKIGVLLAFALAGYFFFRTSAKTAGGTLFAAKRGPLSITVLEGGSVEALEFQEIRSQVKGYQGTKILSIVEEGYLVNDEDIKTGKVLVELDSSDLRQRMTTEEINFQSVLSTLIEAQQAFDIQLNQNDTDIKAAEQKARFARMDLEKHIGDKNTQNIIDKLGLYEKPFTNGLDLLDMDNALLPDAKRVPAPGTSSIAPSRPGTVADARVLSPVGGDQPLRGPTGAGSAVSVDRKPAVTAPSGISAPVSGLPAAGSLGQGSSPSAGDSAAFQRFEMTDATNLLAKLNSAGKGSSSSTNPAVLIDFSLYATNVDLLGDGAAKQQLRKLDDDLFLAQQDLGQSIIKLEGSRRLLTNGFITKTEFDGDDLAVSRNKVRVDAAKTALELYKKYEFTKASEEFVSKYDESLRALERARKEAVSKLAQARARLKSAEGRYRIALEQRQELSEQVSNCTIRAKRPGLVVYGGSDERRFYGGEEQIREGATVRERQSIITIPDMTQMAVKVRIHESHIKKVKKGQKARIQVDAFPDEKLEGEVIKVGVLPDSQNRWMNPDMKVYLTSIRIDGVRDWLKPGMSAKVEILVKELTNVVYVPIQAVSTVNAKQVCYLHRLGESEQRTVEIGDFNDEFIEIKSGLRENDRVLLRAPVGTGPEQLPAEGEEDGPAKGTPAAPKPAGATPAATAAPRPAQPAAAGPPPGASSSSLNRAN